MEEKAKKEYPTTASEIMEVGAKVIMEMFFENPSTMLIEDQLTNVVSRLAAKWICMKEDEE